MWGCPLPGAGVAAGGKEGRWAARSPAKFPFPPRLLLAAAGSSLMPIYMLVSHMKVLH